MSLTLEQFAEEILAHTHYSRDDLYIIAAQEYYRAIDHAGTIDIKFDKNSGYWEITTDKGTTLETSLKKFSPASYENCSKLIKSLGYAD